MKYSKLNCRAAIFVPTVSSMHKLIARGSEATNCERMSIIVDKLGENKKMFKAGNSCLLLLNVLCCHRVCIC